MFTKKSSRHSLALFVALALGSGALLAPSAAGAADVNGQNVEIDDAHPTVAADHKVGTDGAAGGAITSAADTGNVANNTLTLTKRSFTGSLYGGYTLGNGNVTGNKLFIHDETSHVVQEKVYGGHANGSGHATGNTVTLTGGIFSDNIYGGSSVAGNATGNTVNLGDGNKPFQGSFHGTIYGGDGPGTGDYVTGNTLNVNTNIIAENIKNFSTINFNYNNTVGAGTMLQLDDNANKRTSVDWNGIHLTGTPDRAFSLMSNSNGIDISNYDGGFKHLTLTATHEAFVAPGKPLGGNRYQMINYERNQFAGVRKNNVNTSDGTPSISEVDVYGGESKIGNTTTNNEVTITNAPGHGEVYGGYTEGDGTTADVAKRYDSTGNKVTITGGAASKLYGGYTSSSAGIATGNIVTTKGGTVRNNIYGGYSVYGDATGNTVNLGDDTSTSAGTIQGEIFGGRSTVTTKDQTTGNTLNVNTNAAAKNIWNFSTINFNFSTHVNAANTLLTLNGTHATKLKSLDQLHVKDVPRGEGTLMENANGINISEYSGAVKRTAEKTETLIDKDGTTKISYKGYQFKDSTSIRTAGTDTWGGRSVIGNTTTNNHISLTSGLYTDIYGGWTSGTGSTATGTDARNQSIANSVTLNGATAHTLTGGKAESGDARKNRVVVRSGTVTGNIKAGIASGKASGNTVNIEGGAVTGQIYGGDGDAEASGNVITITKGTVNGDIIGGYSQNGAAKGNTVNLGDGITSYAATINGKLIGGQTTLGSVSNNILNIKANASATNVEDFETYKFHLNSGTVNKANTLLTLTEGTGTNLDNLDRIDVDGTLNGKATLMANTHGISLGSYANAVVKTHGNKEAVIDTDNHTASAQTITYEGYQFAQKDTMTTVTESGVTSTWGGRSVGSNSTHENVVTIASGTHTNIYGGWTAGSGTTAADKGASYKNKVKINGSANVAGTVYGGFTSVAGGKATINEVTIEKNLTANIVGGKSATGEASGNIVNLANATVASVTGGDGATTNNNIVNLNGGANITGMITGGSQANGTGNTLNVKGANSAGTISNFQKLHFDTTGATAANPLLNITGGVTNLDWNTLDASGTSVNRMTLLKNAAGINLSNHTPGTVKSKINEAGSTEYNIDVEKTGTLTTDITYQGYQFKGKATATTEGNDTYGGRSKAGNTTTENDLTVDSGNHTNIYGGWTTGTGSTAEAAKQKDSTNNKVTIKGLATAAGNVIGGLTEAAGGKTTGNTVTVEKDLAANIIGGKAVTGEASGNTINLANATVNSVTGGEGATTNNNTVNLNGSAQVTGALKGGSQAGSTDNTINVKGKNNKAGSIENIQKMNFDATGLAKDDTMLEATGAGETTVNWANLKASGTAAKPLTLLKNTNGINLAGYTGEAKSETGDTTETNIDVRKTGGKVTEITYEGYQFKGVTQATTDGDTFGGISKAGNSTRENEINVESGTHANIYGGWTTGSGTTAADNGASYKNKVTVNGSANVTGTVYGGFTNVAGGKATANEVTVTGGTVHDVVGGEAKGEASGNTVTVGANAGVVTGGRSAGEASNNIVNLANAAVNSITGGEGATTNDNTINLNGNAQITGTLTGGSQANGTGNTLNVKGVNSASTVTGFQKMNFDATGAPTDAALLRTTGATDVNWETLTVKNGVASEKPLTLLENANGINISGRTGDAVKSELNTDATMETNIDVRQSGSKVTAITYEGYTFRGAAKATTYGADTWAGRSKAGNTTQDNKLTLDDASKTYANVYGGWTSGTGTKAAADKQNNSLNNTVDYTAGTVTGTLYGGYAANGEASGNTVNLGAITSAANIYGGFGATTKNNTINLKSARITGTVTGGSANGTGNTLAVYKPSEVHDFAGVQNLHFYTEEMAANVATPMLKLGTATKDIRGLNIGVARSGAAPKLIKGDKILLMKTAGGALATDAAIQNKVEGMQGVSRRYEYEIKQEATGELTATVTKAGFAEQAKSLVETRAGLASFVNQGADYLVQDGLAAAEMSVNASDADKGGKNAQRQGASSDGAAYQLWAGAGANSMRAESGSYVDSKGWNLGVGWAREDVQKDGAKVLFSPFVEYGRGTYDSYLDDGTHGSGKISYIGAGILGKLTQKDGLWLEGSLRAGRSKSDYSANLSGTAASYDGSNTYYGAHLGAGKTFAIKENSSIDAYARYFWSHQNSMTATLNTGDLYEFGSVNSQRLRLGLRYSLKDKTTGEFYAGLAWEHEFAGKAGATYQGDAAPSPSLKGSSTMLELGYRFSPENSRVSYDLHLNGWQGKRKGITGGASVKWAF